MAHYDKTSPPPYGAQVPPAMCVPPPALVNFGPESQTCVCPHCHAQIRTTTKSESNTKTHLFALLLCLIFCPCVCLPYCMDSCKSLNHYCPNCQAYLGSHDH